MFANRKGKLAFTASVVALSTVSQLAAAQDNTGQTLDTVTVTATRRDGNLQRTPAAIAVVSRAEYEKASLTGIKSLEMVTPSLAVNDFGGSTQIFLRGAGSTSLGPGNYSSVAVYLDGSYLARPAAFNYDFGNIESIQVLKGPQGALYGRNATSGAILLKTKTPEPGQALEGYVEGSYGNYDQWSAKAGFSKGLGDKFAASANFYMRQANGYIESSLGEDLGDRDSWGIVSKLVFDPTDNLNFVFSFSQNQQFDRSMGGAQSVDAAGSASFAAAALGSVACQSANAANLFAACTPAQLGAFLGAAADAGDPNNGLALATLGAAGSFEFGNPDDRLDSAFDQADLFFPNVRDYKDGTFGNFRDRRYQLNATYEADAFKIESTTAFNSPATTQTSSVLPYTISNDAAVDNFVAALSAVSPVGSYLAGLLNPLGQIGFSGDYGSNTFSQEVVVTSKDSPIDWIIGGTYFYDEGDPLIVGDAFGLSSYIADDHFEVESGAVFAEVTVPLTDALSVTGGVRYTDENYTLTDHFDDSGTNPLYTPGVQNVGTEKQSFNKISWSAVLDYALSDNVFLYASAKTGFKSGVLNPVAPSTGGVGPEENRAIEVGAKTEWADGRIRLNMAGFYYDYQNIHVQTVDGGSGATVQIDGATAEIYGFEADLIARIADGFTFNSGIQVLDAEYTSDASATPLIGGVPTLVTMAISGNTPPGAPDFVLTAGLNYEHSLPQGRLNFDAIFNYNSGYYFEAENVVGTGGASDEGYSLLNLSATYEMDNGVYIRGWARNVLDEDYFRSGLLQSGINAVAVKSAPAEYGVTIGFKF